MMEIDTSKIPGYDDLLAKIDSLSKQHSIENVSFFTKGHRGIIFQGNIKQKDSNDKKTVIIKIEREDIDANAVIQNEITRLLFLEKHNIGPKILLSGKDYFVYEFVEGEYYQDFIAHSSREDIIKVTNKCFSQMFTLDSLNLNKEEMHHPYKHIIINNKKEVVLLDFERCKFSPSPKNVTQFCQFIVSSKLSDTFKEKGFCFKRDEIMDLAKRYKNEPNKENFEQILKCISKN